MNLCTQSKCLLGGSVSAFVSIKDTLFVNLLCCPKEMRERLTARLSHIPSNFLDIMVLCICFNHLCSVYHCNGCSLARLVQEYFALLLLLAVHCFALGLLMHKMSFPGIFNLTQCWTCLFLGMVVHFTHTSTRGCTAPH